MQEKTTILKEKDKAFLDRITLLAMYLLVDYDTEYSNYILLKKTKYSLNLDFRYYDELEIFIIEELLRLGYSDLEISLFLRDEFLPKLGNLMPLYKHYNVFESNYESRKPIIEGIAFLIILTFIFIVLFPIESFLFYAIYLLTITAIILFIKTHTAHMRFDKVKKTIGYISFIDGRPTSDLLPKIRAAYNQLC